jgi:hypothetical protein
MEIRTMLTERQRAQTALRQKLFRKRQKEARRKEQLEKGLPPMPAISSMPGKARWQATIEAAEELVRQAALEMEMYQEVRSEAWCESYAGEEHQQREKDLTKIADTLGEILILW